MRIVYGDIKALGTPIDALGVSFFFFLKRPEMKDTTSGKRCAYFIASRIIMPMLAVGTARERSEYATISYFITSQFALGYT